MDKFQSKKREETSTSILGISCYYHDSAACLLQDGKLIAAAQEERFSRIKNDKGFPIQAITFCLAKAGIEISKLDYIVYYEKPIQALDRTLTSFLSVAPKGLSAWMESAPSWMHQKLIVPRTLKSRFNYEGNILFAEHHESHAASAFYPSPFERSAVLTLDGVGEWATATCSLGNGNSLKLMKQMNFPNSLGLLYSAFTAYLGFKVNSGEYKLMGLAPYGEPRFKGHILNDLLNVMEDGSISLNMEYFDFLSGREMTNERFYKLFGRCPREPESPLTRFDADIAASVQTVAEYVIMKMAHHLYAITGERNLCMAGGVALNCVANGKLLKHGPFRDIWIQPAAGDAGGALGAALAVWYRMLGNEKKPSSRMSCFLGPEYSNEEIKTYLSENEIRSTVLEAHERAGIIARMINDGMVVGYMSGRMEFGPRALGARSILGDPRKLSTQHVVNQKIKFRESFRPFAPSVLEECAVEYFDIDRASPYMMFTAPVKERHRRHQKLSRSQDIFEQLNFARSHIPAVTHVDYSARLQTVSRDDKLDYYQLIEAFEQYTKCPLIVNTSFNVRGEPIVCTPEDAFKCFMKTDMDVLVLGDHLILKKDQINLPLDYGLQPYPSLKPKEVRRKSRLPAFITGVFFAIFAAANSIVPMWIFGALFLSNLGCLFFPTQFKPFFRLMHYIVGKVQAFISRIILISSYFLVITPVAIIWRLSGSSINFKTGNTESTWVTTRGFQSLERYYKRF